MARARGKWQRMVVMRGGGWDLSGMNEQIKKLQQGSIQNNLNMNKYDQDELDAFIVEAELINQKVKALANNTLSPEEFDRLEQARAEDKRKREAAKVRKQQEAKEKKRLGHEGKGISKDFMNFCRFCHWQYQLPTPVCLRCNKNTMTLKERQAQLEEMVENYKNKKKSREDRKNKWEMWQKTKSMLWKKTSNTYDKWDYFISDSEEEPESEPVVPKNDPNFMALERDMEERKERRRKDNQNAKRLKDKGNAFMKDGKYQEAMEQYTLALQHARDMKTVYTNRALAYIKLGKFKKAVADCVNVLEYMEVFEKAEQNKDLCFKANLRKALANKELKNFKEALDDVNAAIKIFPTDKQALMMKKEIEGFIEHKEKVEKLLRESKNPESEQKPKQQEDEPVNAEDDMPEKIPTEEQSKLEEQRIIKQLAEQRLQQEKAAAIQKQPKEVIVKQAELPKPENPVEEVKQKIENLSKHNIDDLFKLFRKNQELISIFIAAKGIRKCLDQLMVSDECNKEGFLVSCCLRGDGVGEKQVWDFKVSKIYGRINSLLEDSSEMSMSKYFILEDIFEVLIPMSLHEKYRELLAESPETHKFIELTFSRLISRHKKQPDLFSSFLIYASNLCSGNSKLRDTFITDSAFNVIVGLLYEKVVTRKTTNRAYLNLRKNVYSLYANLIINQEHRNRFNAYFSQEEQDGDKKRARWEDLISDVRSYPKSNENFTEYIEALLSVFTNATLGTALFIPNLSESLIDRYLSNPQNYTHQTLHRVLLTLCRVKHTDLLDYKKMLNSFSVHLNFWKEVKQGRNLMEQIIRALNMMYAGIEGQKFNQPLPANLLAQCKSYISTLECGETIFCNTCNLFGLVLESVPAFKPKVYSELKPVIKFLIEVAKDKVGNWRKNSSILLAKLSMDPQCKQELYKNHGMEVLKSIAEFVKK